MLALAALFTFTSLGFFPHCSPHSSAPPSLPHFLPLLLPFLSLSRSAPSRPSRSLTREWQWREGTGTELHSAGMGWESIGIESSETSRSLTREWQWRGTWSAQAAAAPHPTHPQLSSCPAFFLPTVSAVPFHLHPSCLPRFVSLQTPLVMPQLQATDPLFLVFSLPAEGRGVGVNTATLPPLPLWPCSFGLQPLLTPLHSLVFLLLHASLVSPCSISSQSAPAAEAHAGGLRGVTPSRACGLLAADTCPACWLRGGAWGQHRRFPSPSPGGLAGTHGDGKEAALQQTDAGAARESIGVGLAPSRSLGVKRRLQLRKQSSRLAAAVAAAEAAATAAVAAAGVGGLGAG
ncbi:unnamed protein product [Closterium sp. NIES-65]|nr:unnamed protein product [Closterium sp. NIES-65]